MHIPPLIADLALILISAGVTTILFKWLKQPVVLGYIVAGCLVSSQITLTPTVSGTSDIGTWADIGDVFLMFSLGIDFSFKKLLNVGRSAIVAALVIIFFMIVSGFFVGLMLGWGTTNSILLGGMISMSSTAIIIKAFDDLGLRSQKFTRLVFGILVFEDIIAILLMVVVSTIDVSKSFEGSELIMGILKLVFFLVVWLVFGIYFIPNILKWGKKVLNDETLLIFSLGLCFGMVLFALNVGFSSALGAFVMGSVLAETLEAERIEHLVKPLKDLFGAIFFVSVGMMVDFNILIEYAVPILAITATIIIGQITFATTGILLSGQTLKVAIQSGFCLTQIGEFAFIIALLGIDLGIIDSFIYPVIVAVSVITIFITPFMIRLSEPAYNFLERTLPESWKTQLDKRAAAGQSVRSENVWRSLLIQVLKIVGIYSILIVALLILCVRYLTPFITSQIEGFWGALLASTITIVLIAPFLRAIVAKKNHSIEYKYLWKSNKFNHAPLVVLVFLRILLAASFVCFVLAKTFNGSIGLLGLISTALIALMMISRRLKLYSITIERKFLHNLNSREYEKSQQMIKSEVFHKKDLAQHLSTHDIHLIDFDIKQGASCIGKTLKQLNCRQKYGVHIVAIMRGDTRINIPGGNELLLPLDKILVLGTDEQLGKFQQTELDSNSGSAITPKQAIKRVCLEQFELDQHSPLVGKTLLESGIREHSKCLVVGVERDGMALMNPDAKTVFQKGDFIWVVGERDMIHQMMQNKESISVMEEQ